MSRRTLWIIFFGGIANLAVFMGVADQLGGDALNGRVEAGHYYLGSHGRLTEVSRDVFTYSWWHAVSLMVTQPLALLTGWCAAKFDQL
jgi:hypothetical protein